MADGSAKARFIRPNVLEIVWAGVIDGVCVVDADQQVAALLAKNERIRFLIQDALDVVTYRPSVAGPAAQLMKRIREHGGKEFVLVTRSAAIRMMAGTIAFGAGMTIHTAADRAAALAIVTERVPG